MPATRSSLRWCRLLLLAAGAVPHLQAATLHGVVRHVGDGRPLVIDSLRYRTKAGEAFSIVRASWLMSGFALRQETGSWLEVKDQVAWLDAAKGRTRFALSGIPEGRYTALRFHVGPDAATNAADPFKHAPDHPLNPNVNGLHWSWMGGYIFLALEGRWRDAGGRLGGFAYHLARDANRCAVELPAKLDLSTHARAEITFDLAALLNGPAAISPSKDGGSTHSQPGDPIATALVANLATAFTLQSVAPEPPPPNDDRAGKPVALPAASTPFAFPARAAFPVPALPPDNPLTHERIALGRRLFHDATLSRTGTVSCASCHPQATAFADPRRFSPGVEGRTGTRQSMPLFNLAWKTRFFWDGRAPSLRAQALIPIQDHLEMDDSLESVAAKLQRTSTTHFEKAFGTPHVTPERIGLAIENFLLTLTSQDSKFDRAMRGEDRLSAEEQRGFDLFMMEREPRMGSMGADCFHCHGGPLFTDHQFRNNGLAITGSDLGRFRVTRSTLDRGTFATPSLRNIALTAPYMHDGRFQTLEEVLDHYSEGVQRTDTLDSNLAKHPDGGLHLTVEEKHALIAFLKSLTDPQFESR